MSLPLLPLGMRGSGEGRGGPGSDGVGTASQGSPGTSGFPLLGQSTWGRSKQVSTLIFFKGWQVRLLRAHIAQGAAKGRHVHRRPVCMLVCSIFVLRPCWLQRWTVGVFIMKNVWFTAVKFLSLMKSVHCRHPVTDGRVPQRAVSCPLPTWPRDSQVCPLLSAVLLVHPDHLLGRALSSHPGLHLQGKCTYLAPGALAHSWPALRPQRVSQSQRPLIQWFQLQSQSTTPVKPHSPKRNLRACPCKGFPEDQSQRALKGLRSFQASGATPSLTLESSILCLAQHWPSSSCFIVQG